MDEYFSAFHSIVRETQEKIGYTLPVDLESYIIMLLSHHLDRPDFLPERSFAEAYFKVSRRRKTNAKELGDTCLFLTGVFPTYGRRRGISRRYYQHIGSSSYSIVAESSSGELFIQLATHFKFLSNFIEVSIRNPKHKYHLIDLN
ncbi:uncharacterized protein METZ01_LOCUS170404 [marine metagenome]|uniref:Uncharacterized protein n=1 Tax=marine metagenome TaxID=408172 RepID=A0A382BUQ7_9ZZZZ|tara:strand:+ start:425 stop:859 length:435 start_codon:yes stop_codon:yes gene_type:complete